MYAIWEEPKTLVSELSVGSSVFLNVNGVSTEFLVVHQGNPDSSLYDDSCDGTWLLMKDVYENRVWHSSASNVYKNSTIHSYLNGNFLALFDDSVQGAIKQVKIPYANGLGTSTVTSGSNGLSTKIFLLSGYEVGFTQSVNELFPIDGACLSYFNGASYANRVAYMNGQLTTWWFRSPDIRQTDYILLAPSGGEASCTQSFGVRPAMILAPDIQIDPDTNELML